MRHPDLDALLSAATAAPVDAAPKLIAADWVEERGGSPNLVRGLQWLAQARLWPELCKDWSGKPVIYPWRLPDWTLMKEGDNRRTVFAAVCQMFICHTGCGCRGDDLIDLLNRVGLAERALKTGGGE